MNHYKYDFETKSSLQEYCESFLRNSNKVIEAFYNESLRLFNLRLHLGRNHSHPIGRYIVNTCAAFKTIKYNSWVNEDVLSLPGFDFIKILKDTASKDKFPWDIFAPSSQETSVYTTVKVIQGLGKEYFEKINRPNLFSNIQERLKSYLNSTDKPNPYLTYLCIDALDKIGYLDESMKSCIAKWAKNYLDEMLSSYSVGDKEKINSSFFTLYLTVLVHFGKISLSENYLERCLQIIIEEMDPLPWHSKENIRRVDSRAIGCSVFEILTFFLQQDILSNYLVRDLKYINKIISWLEHNSSLYNDLTFFYTDVFIEERRIETWFNCLLLDFLEILNKRVSEDSRRAILVKLNSRIPVPTVNFSDIITGGYKWKEIIKESVIKKAKIWEPSEGGMGENGIILFGPPGTGKTTIGEVIAKELGNWAFSELTTADFLTGGQEGLFRKILDIFDDLLRIDRTVVMFDELELLMLEREKEKIGSWASGLITNIMLPILKKLHDRGRIIYIVATNFIERFDRAITRPGRFDFVLPVGPPSKAEKKHLLKKMGKNDDFANELSDVINQRATIVEILQWDKRLRESLAKCPSSIEKLGKELWKSKFEDNLRISEPQYKQFEKQAKKYTYPPEVLT